MTDTKKQKERLLNKIRNLREEVTCSICKDLFNKPITLECLHSYCKDCFTTLTRFSKDLIHIQCPLCKKYMKRRSFIPNSDLEIAIEVVKKYTNVIDKYWNNDKNTKQMKENKKLIVKRPVGRPKNSKPKENDYRQLPIQKQLRKTRSLDCIVTKEKNKQKRYSLGNDTNLKSNELDSENCFKVFNAIKKTDADKKIINLLEEDCLAKLENEFGGNKKSGARSSSLEASGWGRMKNTKKTIEPKGRKLRQLNISTFSNNEKKENVDNNVKNRGRNAQPSKRKYPFHENINNKNETSPLKKGPTVKLDQFEAYIQEKLSKNDKETKNESFLTETKEKKSKSVDTKQKSILENSEKENNPVTPRRSGRKPLIKDGNLNITSNSVEKKININKNTSPKKKLRNENKAIQDEDENYLFNLPTQKLIENEDIFSVPTQKLSENYDSFETTKQSDNDFDLIKIWSPIKSSERPITSQTTVISNSEQSEEIVVCVQVHKPPVNVNNSYIKLPEVEHKNDYENVEKELELLRNDIVRNSGIVDELHTVLSLSKSLFSSVSQNKNVSVSSIKPNFDNIPTARHCKEVVDFYNSAIPYINNLKTLYNTFTSGLREIVLNTKKLSEIFQKNVDSIDFLVSQNTSLVTTVTFNEAVHLKVDCLTQTDELKCPKCEYVFNVKSSVENDGFKSTNKCLMGESEENLLNDDVDDNFFDIDENIIDTEANDGKKYKRIRMQSPDSPDLSINKKPKFNGLEKYENVGVDIVFLSEMTETEKADERNKPDSSNDLQKLLEKYKFESKKRTNTNEKSINKDNDTQDYALKYMELLEKDYKELNFNEEKNKKTISIENNNKNTQKETVTVERNEILNSLLTNSMFDNSFTGRNVKNVQTQLSKSLFTETQQAKPISNTDKFSISMFTEQPRKPEENNEKDLFEDEELDNEVAEHLNNSIIEDSLDGDDDLFKNIDMVDNTPQKDKPVRSFRTVQKTRLENLMENVVSDFNFENTDPLHIAPPLEFQDVVINEERSPMTLELFSLSPEPTNKQLLNRNIETEDEIDFITNENVSTPKTRKNSITDHSFIYVSTITNKSQTSENLNPIVLAQNDLNSPLTIVKTTNYVPKPILSSTPKQKSILNYVNNKTPSNTLKNDSIASKRSICFTPKSTQQPKHDDRIEPLKHQLSFIQPHLRVFKKTICIACTRLNRDENHQIVELTKKLKVLYCNKFTNEVTHMVVSVDERNRIQDHTMKYVSAAANGVWIVSFAWIQECQKVGRLVSEEPYEVLDVTGLPGPRRSRLTRKNNLLFKDFAFYCAEPFQSVTRIDLENVVRNLGAIVILKLNDFKTIKNKTCLIITEAKISQDFEQYQGWLEEFHVISVDVEWLSRTIGQYQITSVRPFMLCLDDGIENFGYPSSIIAVISENFDDMTELENTRA